MQLCNNDFYFRKQKYVVTTGKTDPEEQVNIQKRPNILPCPSLSIHYGLGTSTG